MLRIPSRNYVQYQSRPELTMEIITKGITVGLLGVLILPVNFHPMYGGKLATEKVPFVHHLKYSHVKASVPLQIQFLRVDAVQLGRLSQRHLRPIQTQVANLFSFTNIKKNLTFLFPFQQLFLKIL